MLAIAEAALSISFSLFIIIINGEPLMTEQHDTTILEISNSVSISLTDEDHAVSSCHYFFYLLSLVLLRLSLQNAWVLER